MKTTLKIVSLAVIMAAMLYNLQVSQDRSGKTTGLAYVKNTVQAQSESTGEYATMITDNYISTTNTVSPDGRPCQVTAQYSVVQCSGAGDLMCQPSTQVTVIQSTC